jgi:hypothetical protein
LLVAVYIRNSNKKSIAANETAGLIPKDARVRDKGTRWAGVAEKIQLVQKVWAFSHYGNEAEAPLCSNPDIS